ncbi:MAG: XRE family transcriptional regulator [Clostridia bacterium]|nr:XRE family transcriptional regulator [Clostridia bacterium]
MDTYARIFAENLRRFRKHMHWTQEQLGEKLGYSEKAVSKWESGNSIPPAETLLVLADALNVTLDDLFSHTSVPQYYLGIDGGATKTTFALADRSGAILQKITLGPSNPFDIGFEAASELLSRGINQITSNIHKRKISVFAGISGGGTEKMRERFNAFLDGFGFLSASCDSDAANIIAAGLKGEDGIVVIMGTGSSCFVSRDGERSLVGGLGYLFDHAGSGYDLGNEAIRAACCQEDGSGEPTLIHDYMLETLKTETVLENLTHFYSIGKRGIASYSLLVIRAYEAGDKVAERILVDNMEHVADLIITASRRLESTEGKIKVVCVGGLTHKSEHLFPMIYSHLSDKGYSDRFEISAFVGDVVLGALLMSGIECQESALESKE